MKLEAVRKLWRALPEVEEGTMYGEPAVKLKGKHMIACVPSHQSAEPDSLVLYLDFEQRDALLEDAPDTYYLKPHYENYPCVLVRLKKIDADAMRDLLHASWQFVGAKHSKRKRSPASGRRARK